MGIKIGNIDVSYFKVGNADCKIYLGDTLLYPQVKNYLRFVAREDGQFKLSGNTIEYSLDSGETWTSLASDTYSPTVSSGSSIMLKATNLPLVTNNGIGKFVSTGTFDIEGNIMSLIYGDDFETATTITNSGQFRSLFDSNANVINASGMTLPATTITQDAYRSMFISCPNLATAPSVLPATTLGESCYKYMFRYCTSLTTPPTLPATTLEQSCYANMFQGCTSLASAPALPATTVQRQCYEYMFSGCTSLTTAPELDAPTLGYQSYRYMFANCTSLNYIKCLATDISAYQCLNYWVNNVASSGTFVKDANMSGWSTGRNGIPTNWTVEDYSSFQGKWLATYSDSHTESAVCDSSSAITNGEITLTNLETVQIGDCVTSISGAAFYECSSLISVNIPDSVTSIGNSAFEGCSGMTTCTIGSGVTSIGSWAFSNCSSLTSIDIPDSVTSIGEYVFAYCRGLTSCTIGSGVTSIGAYAFYNCSGLTSIDIPDSVTSIGDFAFYGCRSLTSVTVNATTPPTLGEFAFDSTNNAPILVPAQSVSAYKTASGWSNYADRITAIPS